jgi:hypothetical protein
VAEGLLEIGRMLVDDLEAIVAGLPPRELAQAEPELIGRYAHGGPRATSGSAPAV